MAKLKQSVVTMPIRLAPVPSVPRMVAARVIHGDCKEQLKTLDSESFDSLVTDPPAGISFMGKAWDSYESLHHFQDDLTVIFKEALRVMKPGAHGLVWALPRTSGFTMMALVDAGFEIRDSIVHLFGSGMPKGLNVAKAGAGAEWEGWNTTLKPAHEIWWFVRKPLSEPTIVKQVQATGTGAINIDACRVGTQTRTNAGRASASRVARGGYGLLSGTKTEIHDHGRWPANAVLSHAEGCVDGGECSDECAVSALDEQSGQLTSGSNSHRRQPWTGYNQHLQPLGTAEVSYGDTGGASRFFYTSKVAPNERKLSDGSTNAHPTAKSTKLMRYFVRLITPPNGTVLDPFAGSGTTGVAAVKEGFSFVGIELDPEHYRVATLRVASTLDERADANLVESLLAEEP